MRFVKTSTTKERQPPITIVKRTIARMCNRLVIPLKTIRNYETDVDRLYE